MTHTCQVGPLCGADPGTCEHDSCMEIVFNTCDACEDEAMQGMFVRCRRHGFVGMTDSGFMRTVMGRLYWATYTCGCMETDDPEEVRTV